MTSSVFPVTRERAWTNATAANCYEGSNQHPLRLFGSMGMRVPRITRGTIDVPTSFLVDLVLQVRAQVDQRRKATAAGQKVLVWVHPIVLQGI